MLTITLTMRFKNINGHEQDHYIPPFRGDNEVLAQ